MYLLYCNVLYFFFCTGAHVETESITLSIKLALSPQNFAASNNVDLKLIASIVSSPISCNFQRDNQDAVIFCANGCINDVLNEDNSIDCDEDGNSVTFIYTVQSPLSTQLNYVVSGFVLTQIATQTTI